MILVLIASLTQHLVQSSIHVLAYQIRYTIKHPMLVSVVLDMDMILKIKIVEVVKI